MVLEQQRNISMQAPVYRQSLDPRAAYLQAEMRTSKTPDSPHDDSPDEQCKAHVKGQYHELEKNHGRFEAAQYQHASPCV